jgi:NCS1 family nucleobase:cation symporter-1
VPEDSRPATNRPRRLEARSFDYVPLAERKGRAWHQGPFWLMAEAELLTVATGFVGGSLGLSLGWSLLAITCGVIIGSFFVAFHAVQGPRLGLPQMIQSRAQFGVRGAVIPILMVVFLYVGFTAFDAIVAGDAIRELLGFAQHNLLIVVSVAIAFVLALVGHDLLHSVARWLAYISLVVFGVFTVGVLIFYQGSTATPAAPQGFALSAFLTQFGAAAAYVIGFAVYTSDFTRYLRRDSSARTVITWTYLGHAVGAIWFMALGAVLFTQFPDDGINAMIRISGDRVFPGFGTLTLIVAVPGLITIMAVNLYGVVTSGTSAIAAFRKVTATLGLRVRTLAAASILVTVIAVSASENFLASYTNFVTILLYFLMPWTAINLVDFYVVRRGNYAIVDIFRMDGGEYGRWSRPGIVAYFVGFIAMVPFFGTSIYTGPLAKAWLGGADISFLVGLLVGGAVYWLLTRDIDLQAERNRAQKQEAEMERLTDESVNAN